MISSKLTISTIILLLITFNITANAKAPLNSLKLTSKEKVFLKKHHTIRVQSEKDWSPYNYTKSNKPKGYSNEYMKLLTDKLGIKIKFVTGKELPSYINMLKEKKIDIISNIQPRNIQNNVAIFSKKPIFSVPMSILTKKDQKKFSDFKKLGNRQIAITKDMFVTKNKKNNYSALIKKNYSNIKFAYKSDLKGTILMVANGSASAAIATNGFFNHYMKHNNIKGLVSVPLINNPYIKPLKYYIAVRKDWPLLKSALDKAMKAVSSRELKYLNDKWLSPKIITKSMPKPVVKKVEPPKPVVKKVEPPKPVVKKVEPKAVIQKITYPEPVVDEVIIQPKNIQPVANEQQSINNKKDITVTNETKTYSDNLTLYMTISAVIGLLFIILLFAYISIRRSFSKLKVEADTLKSQQNEVNDTSRAKDNHLAQISHEIRTPINAVLGMSTLALQTELNTQQHGYISKIYSSSNMLLGLVNQILDYSKLEAGQMPLDVKEFNLNSVFENLSDIIYIKADEKGLDVIFDVEHDVPVHLMGDSMRINQILINLISNALKFTNNGEISVYAKQLKKENSKVLIEFTVSDTGIGIKEENLKKLFKEYQQADSSTASMYGGTGLGLIISKNLITQMGGEIRIESTFGEGTSFIFTLHLDLPEKDEYRKYRLPSKNSMNKKILIIDVSKTSSNALYSKLDYFHFDITSCNSWQGAVEAFESNLGSFDLIFVNAKTFEKDSLKAIIERLSKEPSQIIFIAYNLSQLSKEQINKIDSPVFLERPYSHKRLFDLLVDLENGNINIEEKLQKSKLNLKVISGSRILLVEDNKINQSIVQGMLDGTGIKVIIADNGLEALKALYKDANIDLVLMDINMPIMGGYETVKIIRKDSDLDDIPVIALSASILENDILLSKEAGMDDHLGKPIIMDEFLKMLLKYIKPSLKNKKIVITESKNIDIDDGIERVGGDFKFYKIILSDFKTEYIYSLDKLKTLLAKEDKLKATLFIHDIKGIAANISAKRFYEFTSAFESILHTGEADDYEEYLTMYKSELDRLIKEIGKILTSR